MTITFSEQQKTAIDLAMKYNISILSGGPGVGKSVVTKGIVNAYLAKNPFDSIYLCAPTGRAAKRLEEVTGDKGKTIHRLLGYRPMMGFERNGNNPLPGPGLLIADEMSMTDLPLAYSLFAAIPESIKVVLVGDVDQLPAVGPGNVLRDLIDSGMVPVTRLDYVYRQAAGSGIAYLADYVRRGKLPEEWPNLGFDDVEIIQIEDRSTVADLVVQKYLAAAEAFGGAMNVMALAPMYAGVDGVDRLNEAIRAAVNPPGEDKPEIEFIKGRERISYRLGDKVLVTKNNYLLDVFNGDAGEVIGISKYETERQQPSGMHIKMSDGRTVFFNEATKDVDHLTHAYCTTVHRCQGAESAAVIMAATTRHQLLQRNLFYTGITRAKQKLTILYEPSAMKLCLKRNEPERRNTRLADLIRRGREAKK